LCVTVSFSKKSEEVSFGFILKNSQRLLKGQLHEIYEDLRGFSKKDTYIYFFHFNIKFLSVTIVFSTTSSHCESTKKASGLDPIVDVERRTENTSERLFGRSCARRALFTFVSFAKVTNAPQTKWRRLRF
jgi:hypothetical protein